MKGLLVVIWGLAVNDSRLRVLLLVLLLVVEEGLVVVVCGLLLLLLALVVVVFFFAGLLSVTASPTGTCAAALSARLLLPPL